MHETDEARKLCEAIWEMKKQAPHDFCGEQREFYLPRLDAALLALAQLFPGIVSQTVGGDRYHGPRTDRKVTD